MRLELVCSSCKVLFRHVGLFVCWGFGCRV